MKMKKAVAVLMSALIIISSLAVGGITASASTYSVEQLESLCDTYEQKMNGSAYTNMQAAYDAWYNAQAFLVGVKAGMSNAEDVDTYYTALETAINNMGTWTPATGNAQASFGNDSVGNSYDNYVNSENGFDYTVNLLYSPLCSNYTTNSTVQSVTIDMYYPTTVMLYDGVNVPTMPILALASKGTGNSRYIYQLYPSASNTDSANNPNFRMTENWHAASHSGQQHNANWPWSMDMNNVTGRPQAFAGTASTNDRVELYASTVFGIVTSRGIASLANGMQFIGSMDSNTYSTAYTLDWYRLTGDDATDSGFISNAAAPIYVVNYKALLDTVNNAGLANITDYSYEGATALISAVQQCMNVDPNSYDYASDTAGAVNSCASAIENAVNAVNNAKAALGTMNVSSYMTLAGNYADYTATYAAGQGNYTDASWNAFKTSYESAGDTLAAVVNKTAYMTTASSDELVSAYSNLEENVQMVTYTYHFADGEITTVSAAEGTEPVAPSNSATTSPVSNGNGTHSTTSYSWPAWEKGVTDYTEIANVDTVACSMSEIEAAEEPTRTETGKTAVEQCTVCGYTTGGDVIPATGVQITVEQTELGTSTINSEATTGAAQKVAYGEDYTLVATPSADAEFVGWQVNGKLISTDATYTTAAYADLTYTPVFAEKSGDFTVTFVDQFNMVLDTVTGSELADLEALPTPYNYLGYTFSGWSMTLDEVKALETNAVVTAYYDKDEVTYTVNAPGCTITVGGETYYDTAEVSFDECVTVAAVDAAATAWSVNGANASYGSEYTFFVTADVTVGYTTDEVTAEPTVAAVDTRLTDNGKVRFLATRNVPAGYTLIESGFVYGKDVVDPEASLVLENVNNTCYLYKNSNMAGDGQFALTFGIASQTGVAYARAYVIAADVNGNAAVYYADVQSYDYDA